MSFNGLHQLSESFPATEAGEIDKLSFAHSINSEQLSKTVLCQTFRNSCAYLLVGMQALNKSDHNQRYLKTLSSRGLKLHSFVVPIHLVDQVRAFIKANSGFTVKKQKP